MSNTDKIFERESRHQRAVNAAVAAADRIILDASDGSVEETNLLTGAVAKRFLEKVMIALNHQLAKKDYWAQKS